MFAFVSYIGTGRNGFQGALEALKLLLWSWEGNQSLPFVIDSPMRLDEETSNNEKLALPLPFLDLQKSSPQHADRKSVV